VDTLVAEFGYCTTEAGCVDMTSANGSIENVSLFTEAVVDDTEIRYESPLSREIEYVNEATPAAAVVDWLVLATLPLTRDPDVSDKVARTDGEALSRLSPPELRSDTVMLGLTVALPEEYR
jgi:hypothetical protein